jgi:hypothetical protein
MRADQHLTDAPYFIFDERHGVENAMRAEATRDRDAVFVWLRSGDDKVLAFLTPDIAREWGQQLIDAADATSVEKS